MSKPVQVYLDERDLARLEAWSRKRGWTKSRAVRAAIRALTREPQADPLLELSGILEDLPEDGSEQVDRYLVEAYVAERPPRYRRRPGVRTRLRR